MRIVLVVLISLRLMMVNIYGQKVMKAFGFTNTPTAAKEIKGVIGASINNFEIEGAYSPIKGLSIIGGCQSNFKNQLSTGVGIGTYFFKSSEVNELESGYTEELGSGYGLFATTGFSNTKYSYENREISNRLRENQDLYDFSFQTFDVSLDGRYIQKRKRVDITAGLGYGIHKLDKLTNINIFPGDLEFLAKQLKPRVSYLTLSYSFNFGGPFKVLFLGTRSTYFFTDLPSNLMLNSTFSVGINQNIISYFVYSNKKKASE